MGFGIDMAKAKEIHKNNIRAARTPKLAELDIEFQRALETSADTSAIVAKKKALRDAPANSAIDAAKTEAELIAAWDTCILGTSPYTS
jgi:flagellar basal body rod protein FlgB